MTITHEIQGPFGLARALYPHKPSGGFKLVGDPPAKGTRVRLADGRVGTVEDWYPSSYLGDDVAVTIDDNRRLLFCVGTGDQRFGGRDAPALHIDAVIQPTTTQKEPKTMTKTHPFTVGQLVECIDHSAVASQLTKGKTYKVLQVDSGTSEPFVRIEDDRGNVGGFFTSRFKAVAEAAPKIDWDKPLEYTNGTGLRSAKVILKLSNGGAVVELGSRGPVEYSAEGRSASLGLTGLRNVADVTPGYRNIYSDGSVGATLHKSLETAKLASKVGKTRIGILAIYSTGRTEAFTCEPFTRTSGYAPSEWKTY